MTALHYVFFWLLVAFVILQWIRNGYLSHELKQKKQRIEMLNALLGAGVPGGIIDHIDGERERAQLEIQDAIKKKELAREAFFRGYNVGLRNIRISICGWAK